MTILTNRPESVKPYARLEAELEAEMLAAQRADDATAWLDAWNAREDLRIEQFLAEYPSCSGEDTGPPPEPEEDGPSDLDHIWDTYYALGYDCADAGPGVEMDLIRQWVARLAYDKGWARGLADRSTWLDATEWERIEAEEAEVRSILGHPGWDWDAADFASEGH